MQDFLSAKHTERSHYAFELILIPVYPFSVDYNEED